MRATRCLPNTAPQAFGLNRATSASRMPACRFLRFDARGPCRKVPQLDYGEAHEGRAGKIGHGVDGLVALCLARPLIACSAPLLLRSVCGSLRSQPLGVRAR
eukprot:2688116-Alexandrium_andersonii.AAC.1